jgi:hypothetical protein
MRITTGLVANPIGTDMIAACTFVNCPLPSWATVTKVFPEAGTTNPPPAYNAISNQKHFEENLFFILFQGLG